MALEKTTYTTGDTLTAEKVNDIQDAIISLENTVGTANDTLAALLSEGV